MKNIFLITVFLVDRTLIHDQVSFNFLLTFRFSYLSGSTLVSETETSAPTTVHIYSNGEVKFYLKHIHTTILRVSYVIFCQSHALLGLSIVKKNYGIPWRVFQMPSSFSLSPFEEANTYVFLLSIDKDQQRARDDFETGWYLVFRIK